MSLEDIQWKAGYATVIQKWIELLSKLATLQAKMGCGIGLTANDQTFSVPNPDGPEFWPICQLCSVRFQRRTVTMQLKRSLGGAIRSGI